MGITKQMALITITCTPKETTLGVPVSLSWLVFAEMLQICSVSDSSSFQLCCGCTLRQHALMWWHEGTMSLSYITGARMRSSWCCICRVTENCCNCLTKEVYRLVFSVGKQKIKILINRDNFLCGECMQECKQGQTLVLKSAVKTKDLHQHSG